MSTQHILIGAPNRDFTRHTLPGLAVPCPACEAEAGAPCRRPGGRRAATLHIVRRELMQLLFALQYGDTARLVPARRGWRIERVAAGGTGPDATPAGADAASPGAVPLDPPRP